MITRIWHGRTKSGYADQYSKFLTGSGTREYLDVPENISVKVWRKLDGDVCHFWTVTEWPTIEAIKKFAGEDYEKAKYYPEDSGMLLEFEETVAHYECDDVSNRRIRNYQRQLEELFYGGSWQAESIMGKLKSLSDEDAFAQPIPGIHSVAEIVWHCLYWRLVLIERLQGNYAYRDATMGTLNFLSLAVLEEKGWVNLRKELEDSQARIIELLGQKRDDILSTNFQDGFTFDYLIEGTVHHDLYHLGQIGLVIRIVDELKNKAVL
jgi:Uncharacterized protein conserved in bacteria